MSTCHCSSHCWIKRRCLCGAGCIHIYSWILLCCIWFRGSFINIIFEPALFDLSCGKYHFTPTMLYSSHPLSYIHGTISPFHLSLSLALVVHITSLKLVSTSPYKMTMTMLFIILVSAFVLVDVVSFTFTPLSMTML